MRILALNGSHRGEKGNVQWLLDKLAEGVRGEGAEFETVILAKHKITTCCGCQVCQTAEHLFHCVYELEDDVATIFEKIRAADIVIYATPVYIFGISSLLKRFLERINSTAGGGGLCLTESGLFFHDVDKAVCSKPFVVLTCCGNVEEETVKNIVAYFKTFSRFLDAAIVGTLTRKSIGVIEEDRNLPPDKQNSVVAEVASSYIQAGRELARWGRITSSTQKQANRNILGIPFFDLLMKFKFFKKMALKRRRS